MSGKIFTSRILLDEIQFSAMLQNLAQYGELLFRRVKKVVPHAYAELAIQCLTYLPGPCDERLLGIGKVSVAESDVRNIGRTLILSRKAKLRKTRNLFKTLMLRYLRKVQHISGEFLAERSPYILCCDWNFSPRVNPLRTNPDKYGEQRVCIYRVGKHETTPSLAAL